VEQFVLSRVRFSVLFSNQFDTKRSKRTHKS